MRYRVVLLMLFFLGLISVSSHPVSAEAICFPDQPDITACLEDPFASYWQTNGGLAVFGYPITHAHNERNADLDIELLTQWAERHRLESHPQNAAPYNILLGRMGAERLAHLGRNSAQADRESGPQPGCLWFEETGHNVCDQEPGRGFRTYWETHGLNVEGLDAYNRSLQLFGFPLTAVQMETNSSGDTVLTQWFERARFEWHPNNPDAFKVLLGRLGSELRGDTPTSDDTGTGTPRSGPSVFGVEINNGRVAATAAQAQAANVSWVRYGGILWSDIEAAPGARDWSRLSSADAELQTLAALGATPIVIVRMTPAWAQKVPGSTCGPIRADALDDFASFMRELVTRYSNPPYNVKYWEIGNEVDVDPALVPGDSGFGCWGDQNDPYYGGGYYAEMLKQIYPAIKQANPEAQVIIGGLLLDCDPTNPPAGKDCAPARFLEGILQNGGGAAFDILAYHAYAYWNPATVDWDREHVHWKHRGGALLGKLDFLRTVLNQYGVSKPILMNEGGLLCYPSGIPCAEADPGYYNDQASYAVRLYSRALANDVLGAVWYTLNGPGWRDGGLLDAAQAPRPAYQTLQFMANRLADARYAGPLSNEVLEGYAFRTGATTYQVYWTKNDSRVEITLPAGTRAVYNQTGQPITPAGSSVTVGFEPIFIEVGP